MNNFSEIFNEPDGRINGFKFCIWFYTDETNCIKHVIGAGHTDIRICKEITAYVHEAVVDLKDITLHLFNTGSLWVETTEHNESDQEILTTLKTHLWELMSNTGVVKVYQMNVSEIETVKQKIIVNYNENRRKNKTFYQHVDTQSNNPVFHFAHYPVLPSHNKRLSFKIQKSLIHTKNFPELIRLHITAYSNSLINDAIRRSKIYCKWLLQDITDFMRLKIVKKRFDKIADEMQQPDRFWDSDIIPYSGERDYLLAETRQNKIMDNTFLTIRNLFETWYPVIIKGEDQQKIGEIGVQLLDTCEQWQRNNQFTGEYFTYGLTSFKHRYDVTTPTFIMKDIDSLQAMIKTIILESSTDEIAINHLKNIFTSVFSREIRFDLEAQINECFSDATTLTGLFDSLYDIINTLFKSMGGVPDILTHNLDDVLNKISTIKDDIKKIEKRKKLKEEINESILIDALLRNWPSIFLSNDELKELYDSWVSSIRDRVWSYIANKNKKKIPAITLLQEQNISFKIEKNKDDYIITPYFGLNFNHFACFYTEGLKTGHYYMPWNHKHIVYTAGNAKQEATTLITEFERALNNTEYEIAYEIMKKALEIHPVRACSRLLTLLWDKMNKETDREIEGAQFIAQTLSLFKSDTDYTNVKQLLDKYIAEYPEHYPDPYYYTYCINDLKNIDHYEKKMKHDIDYFNNEIKRLNEFIEINNQFPAYLFGERIEVTNDRDFIMQIIKNDFEYFDQSMFPQVAMQVVKRQIDDIIESKRVQLNAEIEQYKSKIETAHANITTAFTKSPQYAKVLEIDPVFARDISASKSGFFIQSYRFNTNCSPYISLTEANEKMKTVNLLFPLQEKSTKYKYEGDSLAAVIKDELDEIMANDSITMSRNDTEEFEQLKKTLENFTETNEDSISRLHLNDMICNLVAKFAHEAQKNYDQAQQGIKYYNIPAIKWYDTRSLIHPYFLKYITQLSQTRNVALKSQLPENSYTILSDTIMRDRFRGQVSMGTDNVITAVSDEGQVLTQIQLSGTIAPRILDYIRHYVNRGDFSFTVSHQHVLLSDMILKTSIPICPITRDLLKIIMQTQKELTYAMMYFGARLTSPLPGEVNELAYLFRDELLHNDECKNECHKNLKEMDDSKIIQKIDINIESINTELKSHYTGKRGFFKTILGYFIQ